MPAIHVKQGATLQLLIAIANDDGSAFDLTTAVVTAQARNLVGAPFVASLNLVTTGVAGQLSVQQDTSAWPVGILRCDFKLVGSSGVVLKSSTWDLVVDPAVTM